MSEPYGPLHQYIVQHTDDSGHNCDMFVIAHTSEEAFAHWRVHAGIDPEDYRDANDREAGVFLVPEMGDKPGVQSWYSAGEVEPRIFALSHVSLTTQAVAARFVEVATPLEILPIEALFTTVVEDPNVP